MWENNLWLKALTFSISYQFEGSAELFSIDWKIHTPC
jgi:hypothetical protein